MWLISLNEISRVLVWPRSGHGSGLAIQTHKTQRDFNLVPCSLSFVGGNRTRNTAGMAFSVHQQTQQPLKGTASFAPSPTWDMHGHQGWELGVWGHLDTAAQSTLASHQHFTPHSSCRLSACMPTHSSPCPDEVSQIIDTTVLVCLVSVVSTQQHCEEDYLSGHPGLMPTLDPQVPPKERKTFKELGCISSTSLRTGLKVT